MALFVDSLFTFSLLEFFFVTCSVTVLVFRLLFMQQSCSKIENHAVFDAFGERNRKSKYS